jgi:hypothetical protein
VKDSFETFYNLGILDIGNKRKLVIEIKKKTLKRGKKMNRLAFIILVLILSVSAYVIPESYTPDYSFSNTKPYVLFDFDNRKPMNSAGGQSGVFDFDPNNADAYCRVAFIRDEDLHKNGNYMKITYDVASEKPAFNGWWTKLNGMDLSRFDAISITIRGDVERDFSEFFRIEIKDKNKKVGALVENISDVWKKIVIPFRSFEGDVTEIDWKSINEFVIVFEDWRLKVREGRYFIDDISFVPKKGEMISFSELVSNNSAVITEAKR